MDVQMEVGGLAVARPTTVAQALAIEREPDLDAVRLLRPKAADAASLALAGFLVKPYEVNWVSDAPQDRAAFLEKLGKRSRQSFTAADRAVRDIGATTHVVPLTPAALEDFLGLYAGGLEQMRNPIDVATRHRNRIVDRIHDYLMVAVRRDDELVAATLCLSDAGTDLLRIRFSAAGRTLRDAGVSRVMIMAASLEAAPRGLSRVSLGSDLNLYGHIVEPGLLAFKARLGFSPRPDRAILGSGEDVAERLVRMRHLSQPAYAFAYAEDGGPNDDLVLHRFTSEDESRKLPGTVAGWTPVDHVLPY